MMIGVARRLWVSRWAVRWWIGHADRLDPADVWIGLAYFAGRKFDSTRAGWRTCWNVWGPIADSWEPEYPAEQTPTPTGPAYSHGGTFVG